MLDVDAVLARAILACPDTVELAIGGEPSPTEELIGLTDDDGRPVFRCPAGSVLAEAGRANRPAQLSLTSGLGPAGSRDRAHSLLLTGRLHPGRTDEVELEVDRVLLTRVGPERIGRVEVALTDFASPDLRLNPGYLQRAAEHASTRYQDQLRQVVARETGRPAAGLLGVGLTELTAESARLAWVDADGAGHLDLVFSRRARTAGQLEGLLRTEVGAAQS